MKSLQAQLSEKFDALRATGRESAFKFIEASIRDVKKKSIEQRCVEADAEIRRMTPVVKNNGSGDNGTRLHETFVESGVTAAAKADRSFQEDTKRAFMKSGLSEAEACIASGLDPILAEAVQLGWNAEQVSDYGLFRAMRYSEADAKRLVSMGRKP